MRHTWLSAPPAPSVCSVSSFRVGEVSVVKETVTQKAAQLISIKKTIIIQN